MRRDDPKLLKLRGDRERAQSWLDILCRGIGAQFSSTHYPEDIREIINRVNGELLEALAASEKAEEAYRPYWNRRRVRVHKLYRKPRARKSKQPAKQAAKNKKRNLVAHPQAK